ncbi:Cht6 (predicted) [Pycnogonum litorale]
MFYIEYRRVCRYSNSNNAKYTTEQLKKETSCTHIIYTYAKLNEEYLIEYSDKEQDIDLGGYKTVTDLKSTERKVLLSIGALDDSEGRKFSQLVMYQTRIQNFIKRAIKFLKEHNFDGLDIDWRYPACSPSICNVGADY